MKHEKQNLNDLFRSNNYLQLLSVKGILPYQGFPWTFFVYKTYRAQRGMFLDKIGRGNPWLSKTFNFPKKYVVHNSIVFGDEHARIFS